MAKRFNSGRARRSIRQGAATNSRQPETSWANFKGVASCNKNAEIQHANLDLSRIYILTSTSTASASEAVINGLIPYMGRTNIQLIGDKTIGKNVGSNTFGEKESHDYLLHPITLRIYNADHTADYANGFGGI